ncbi:hypothetical protein Cylst_4812 [Cylindrospermum stagnale PCC 7417]|uniref:Uncharacterized protein n=1 Tax=Cylindrospermum stagnale PCC 7417 TaxID=56107 RepID=K9X322_9NOST|nr:hypothetical protein [Cylindrospermum stagnale]AFZ26868.1 hypothetical protein Cylst_4812 [Cylindrospermum stagnale PCC 7417]
MLSNENIPIGFKLFCATPELRIRYFAQANCCVIIFLLPFIVLFMGHIFLLFFTLYEILNIGIVPVMQEILQKITEYWIFPFSFLLLGVATSHALWITFGITEFLAVDDSLIVIKRLLWMSKDQEVTRMNIQYFQQVKDGGEGEDSFPSWGLELITNQKKYDGNISIPSWIPESTINGMIYKKIILLDKQSIEKSDWLGTVLADFYKVEFHSSEKRQ